MMRAVIAVKNCTVLLMNQSFFFLSPCHRAPGDEVGSQYRPYADKERITWVPCV
jgi:hypothetical protein